MRTCHNWLIQLRHLTSKTTSISRRGISYQRFPHELKTPTQIPTPTKIDTRSFRENANNQRFSFYDTTVEEYASQQLRLLSLRYVLEFGRNITDEKLLQSALFLQKELLGRLARPIRNMQSLPFIIGVNPHFRKVYDLYWNSFQQLRASGPILTSEDELTFTETIKQLIHAHTDVINIISRGVHEIRMLPESVGINFDELDGFIDKLLTERISTRALAEQHVSLHLPHPDWIGIIHLSCSPAQIIHSCMERAQKICEQTYGCYPHYLLEGDVETVFPYIPVHLEYMLFELFKNSLRAVVENDGRGHGLPSSGVLPAIVIRINRGDDVTIRLSDQGGGIKKDQQHKVWSYGYTTVTSNNPSSSSQGGFGSNLMGEPAGLGQDFADRGGNPMAGLGYGLPMVRLYARYLAGDVSFVSMPGYGTDFYLTLKPISFDSEHQV